MALKYVVNLGLLILFVACTGQETSDYTVEAIRTPSPPEIDGIEDDPIWQQITPVVLKENRTGNETRDVAIRTQVKSCYDDQTLYFLFLCNDPDIWTSFTQRDEHLWENEAVELFIDVDDEPETYVEIEVSPANVLFDSYIVDTLNIDVPETALFNLKGIRTAVKVAGTLNDRNDKDDHWTVEIAIPLADLGNENIPQVTTATEIRINFYRLDENQGKERMYYAWSPTVDRFHKPASFGRLIFK
ncbi:carbohydrate-binding family 9-like protein [Pareuzebyella sediminis]|uniref:carbohydrate-binding family 9-like protein n=1 Tax=Pareuzebyella sediminis TaxID=2607998 RepID=UPI0018E184A8|nr:carbohydrate-binding family 9-like protein [Pareuzebyella sediminis]